MRRLLILLVAVAVAVPITGCAEQPNGQNSFECLDSNMRKVGSPEQGTIDSDCDGRPDDLDMYPFDVDR